MCETEQFKIVFSRRFDGYAMRYGRHRLDDDDFAEVWRSAQARRSQDIYCWFTTIFQNPSRIRSAIASVGVFLRTFLAIANLLSP
ncbi:hypothetical protein [Bradyrhizobium sp. dw_411]|uniref:hypothetical protein n=1 Tax=Bradyrhizobium sp. dw_411 TaxID=2720082 RepID=UPI001BCCB68D|nr:hypothetical protein [Bradyrhizobium sp. dw_411]